jgi:hypothetical protein
LKEKELPFQTKKKRTKNPFLQKKSSNITG